MRVAVVMPVYNSGRYLLEAINSLLSQTYRDFVLIAVDDGSRDNSLQILRDAEKLDERIVVIEKANGGVASARNVALDYIERARDFDLVSFLDSDDVVEPDFLETYVRAVEKYNADYVVSGFLRWYRNSDVGGLLKRRCMRECVLSKTEALLHFAGDARFKEKVPEATSNLLAHRCFSTRVVEGMRFREDLYSSEDQEFIFRAIRKIGVGVALSKITYLYRQRESSLTHNLKNVESDIRFVFWMLGESERCDLSDRKIVLQYVVRLWWAVTKKVYADSSLRKYRKEVSAIFCEIKKNKEVGNLPGRYRKRILLCGLGGYFISLYFFFRKKEMDLGLEVFE